MWVHYNTYHTKIGKNIKCNIAAFDLDYTLIKPKSGRKFPKDKNDWKFLFDNIIDYLHSLKDYSIVLFTNQSRFNNNIICLNACLLRFEKLIFMPLISNFHLTCKKVLIKFF